MRNIVYMNELYTIRKPAFQEKETINYNKGCYLRLNIIEVIKWHQFK